MKYTFTLRYQLPDDCNLDKLVRRLGASACGDALVGVGKPGRIALEFTREAESQEVALVTALADVMRAIPTATLIEVTPDVGLPDAGEARESTRRLALLGGCEPLLDCVRRRQSTPG